MTIIKLIFARLNWRNLRHGVADWLFFEFKRFRRWRPHILSFTDAIFIAILATLLTFILLFLSAADFEIYLFVLLFEFVPHFQQLNCRVHFCL